MILSLVILMTLGAVSYILYPLVRPRAASLPLGLHEELDDATEQRTRAYEAIHELEFDREVGKLSDEDYRDLYNRYRRQAVAALRLSDEREVVLSALLEQEVRDAAERLRTTESAPVFGAVSADTDSRSDAESRASGEVAPRPTSKQSLSTQEHSAHRRTRWLVASLAALFILVATGTTYVYLRGSSGAARATAVGVVPGESPASIVSAAGDAERLLVGTHNGLMRSEDGGRSWAPVGDLQGQVLSVASNGSSVWALTGDGLHRSSDGGSSWDLLPLDVDLSTIAVSAAADDSLIAMSRDGTFYRSDDGGRTWSRQPADPLPGAAALVEARPEPLLLFAAVPGTGVLVGDGSSWGNASGFVNGALPTTVVHDVVFDASSGEGSSLPGGGRAEGTLYAATDRGVFKSTDHGTSWVQLGLQDDVRSLSVGPSGSGRLYALSSDGSVYVSNDRGVTWGP